MDTHPHTPTHAHTHTHTYVCAGPRRVELLYCSICLDPTQKFLGRHLTSVHPGKLAENVNFFLSVTEIYPTFKSLSGYVYCSKTVVAEIILVSVTLTQ